MRSAALISAALLALLAPAHAAVAVPRGLQPLGAACSAKTPCASGCCSSHMNKDANKTVCVDAKVCSARGQPEWTYCHDDASCASGCCGNWYSDDGLRKCIRGDAPKCLEQPHPFPSPYAPKTPAQGFGGKADGESCSASGPECSSTCCYQGKCANRQWCQATPGKALGESCSNSGFECLSYCCKDGKCSDRKMCYTPDANGNFFVAPPPPPPPAPAPPAPQPQQQQNWGGNSGGSWSFDGKATWYSPCDPNQNHGWSCMGSCDNRVTDWDAVVAMNPGQYSGCGACVEVLDVERGNVARFTVADRCAGCGWGQLDLTPGALNRLGRNTGNWGDAEFPIRWRYC